MRYKLQQLTYSPGSCWAFSATEGLESAWYLAKKKQVILAPQQLVDCSWLDMGCDGGELGNGNQFDCINFPAFRYIESYGLDTEASYPYVSGESGAWSGSCQYTSSNVAARMVNWYYATSNYNETEMLYVSFAKGPLSVCVDAETCKYSTF
jgi:cathepsin F